MGIRCFQGARQSFLTSYYLTIPLLRYDAVEISDLKFAIDLQLAYFCSSFPITDLFCAAPIPCAYQQCNGYRMNFGYML